MSNRKYRPGRKVRGMGELSRLVDRGEYVYWAHKILHFGWVESMQLRSLRYALSGGLLRVAIKEDKGK